MTFANKGTVPTTVIVSRDPDFSGNYVCDGTADEVEINLAIARVLALGGGEVFIRRGTYTIAASITWTGDDVVLKGEGMASVITTADHTIPLITFVGDDNVVWDLHIVGSGGENTLGRGIFGDGNRNQILFNYVEDTAGTGIYLSRAGYAYYCLIFGNTVTGWYSSGDPTNTRYGINHEGRGGIVAYNFVRDGQGPGIRQLSGGGIIAGNEVEGFKYYGIYCVTAPDIVITGNLVAGVDTAAQTEYDVYLVGSYALCCTGNTIRGGWVGVFLDTCYSSTISGNDLNHTTYYCIQVDDSSYGIIISGNHTWESRNTVRRGIGVTDGSTDISIVGNALYNHGMYAIYIDDGIEDVDILTNYIINGGTEDELDGIYLAGNNADIRIALNTIKNRAGYGVNISAASCVDTYVKFNRFEGNVAGAISDSGTDTKLHELPIYVVDPDGTFGYHSGIRLPDGDDTSLNFEIMFPMEFQELVRAPIIVMPYGTGNIVWGVNVHFAKLGGSEVYDFHSHTIAAVTEAVGISLLELIGGATLTDALSGVSVGDLAGVEFTRYGSAGGDTVDADVYFAGARIEYV